MRIEEKMEELAAKLDRGEISPAQVLEFMLSQAKRPQNSMQLTERRADPAALAAGIREAAVGVAARRRAAEMN